MRPLLQIRQGATAGIIVAAVAVPVFAVKNGLSPAEKVGVAAGSLVIISALYLRMSAINRVRVRGDDG